MSKFLNDSKFQLVFFCAPTENHNKAIAEISAIWA